MISVSGSDGFKSDLRKLSSWHKRADLVMGTRVGFVRRFGVGASGMPDKVLLGRDLLRD